MTRTIAALIALGALASCAYVPFRHHHARADASRADAAPAPAPAPVVVDPTVASPTVSDVPDSMTCRLGLLKVLEGRPASAVLAAQALDLSGARSIRWMHPGDVVTMDFRADRLDIKLTHGNVVKSFACG